MAKSPVVFLKEVRTELSKVVWPTRAETTRLTLVVVAVSLAVGIFIGGIDYLFTKVMGIVFGR